MKGLFYVCVFECPKVHGESLVSVNPNNLHSSFRLQQQTMNGINLGVEILHLFLQVLHFLRVLLPRSLHFLYGPEVLRLLAVEVAQSRGAPLLLQQLLSPFRCLHFLHRFSQPPAAVVLSAFFALEKKIRVHRGNGLLVATHTQVQNLERSSKQAVERFR